jgi:hypothetical protein
MIRFDCPSCGTRLSAPDGTGGQQSTCPTCQTKVLIPHEDAIEQAPAPRPSRVADDRYEDRPPRRYEEERDDYREERPRRRRRDEDYDEDYDRPRGKRRGFVCPFCDSPEPPIIKNEVSQAGWIVLVVLILFCWPLFWIGLLMKEEKKVCADCGAKLGT